MRAMHMVAGLATISCAGCYDAANRVTPDPSNKISFDQAFTETQDTLHKAALRTQDYGTTIGYYPCTLSVTFNISATGTSDGKVGLSAGGGVGGATISGNAALDNSITGVRGNVITATFVSSLCIPAATADSTPKGGAGATGAKPGGGAPTPPGRVKPISTQLPPPPPLPLILERLRRQYPDFDIWAIPAPASPAPVPVPAAPASHP